MGHVLHVLPAPFHFLEPNSVCVIPDITPVMAHQLVAHVYFVLHRRHQEPARKYVAAFLIFTLLMAPLRMVQYVLRVLPDHFLVVELTNACVALDIIPVMAHRLVVHV